MDFLKSAVASAISKGPPFAYAFGERLDVNHPLWTLHHGTKREDGSNCSILSFDVNLHRNFLPLARNAVKKLRTLRHPGVLKILDVVETDAYIYIATERVTPLEWHIKRKSLTLETAKWGLYSIAKTVKFINEDAVSIHGNIQPSSVYVSESGGWKIGGFELLSSLEDDAPFICSHGSLAYKLGGHVPADVSKNGWDSLRRQSVTAMDAFQFAMLIDDVFSGCNADRQGSGKAGNVPTSMLKARNQLSNSNSEARLSVGHFLEQGRRNGGFFDTRLIKLTEGVEKLGLQTENERYVFLQEVDEVSDDLPDEFLKTKILPELLRSIEYGGGGPKVFGLIVKLSAKLSEEEYESSITPVIIRLFASRDRAIRVCLLDNLPSLIDHLPQKLVNDKIFPQMVSGFTDIEPVVREQTVKAVLTVIGKLSDRNINGELLKHLARTSNDEQPGIRTNTTICLGKIARNLGAGTRQKVLAAAFTRSLRDPFVHARNAALMALAVTVDVFNEEDCATRLLPALCPLLVDKEKLVRDQVNKTFDVYVQRVRKYGGTLPDTALRSGIVGENSTANTGPRMGTIQNDQSWAGWAISSFTNKISLARGEMQASPQASPQANGSVARSDVARLTSTSPVLDGRPSHWTASTAPKWGLASTYKSTSAAIDDSDDNPTVASFDEGDMDAWGALEDTKDDDDEHDKTTSKAKLRVDEPLTGSTIQPKTSSSSTTTAKSADKSFMAYDDSGEPDFAGWLAAQSQPSKAKGKKPLPKGLSKKQPSLSSTVRVNRASAATVATTTTATVNTQNPKIATRGSAIIAAHPSSGPSVSRVLRTAVDDHDDHDDHGRDLKEGDNPWEEDFITSRPSGGGTETIIGTTRTGRTEDGSSAAVGIKIIEIKPKENAWAEDLDDEWGDGWD